MLVSMGAALFVMIPLQAEGDSPYAATNALSRTIQGVTTGVVFLGAGLILQQSSKSSETPKVRGLTTAASVWIAAALGAAIGCGFWQMGVIKRVRQSVSVRLTQERQPKDRESIASISEDEQESED